jgi:hypothetical protein
MPSSMVVTGAYPSSVRARVMSIVSSRADSQRAGRVSGGRTPLGDEAPAEGAADDPPVTNAALTARSVLSPRG